MIFAVWWRPGRTAPEPLASRVQKVLDAADDRRSNGASTWVATWKPAHLEQEAEGSAVRAVVTSNGRVLRGHPSIRLEGEGLRLIAGPLPDYPAYYVRGPEDEYMVICSRLAPLARLFPRATLNAQRLVYIIRSSSPVSDPDPGSTVYSGLRRLRPCETLVATATGLRMERHLPPSAATYRHRTPEDLARELREQLDAAVGRAIGAAKRVAVFVSGGLDSSGVLALAAARSRGATPKELTALSAQFAAPGDDRPYFRELMDALGLEPVGRSARDAGKWFRHSLCSDGQPGPVSSTCLFMMLSAAAIECGADVALHGGLGDNILSGMVPFAQLARRGRPVAAIAAALRARVPWPTTPWGRVRSLVLSPLLPRRLFRWKRHRAARAAWMTSRATALLDRCLDAAERPARLLPDTPEAWMRALCEDQGQSDSADIAGQAFAVTGCAPIDVFTDLDFVTFIFQIDPVLLNYDGEYRGLYRIAMKGLLPERLRRRQDKGRFEPGIAEAALGANALDMLRDLSSLEALATRDLVDPGPLRPMFERWLAAVGRGERAEPDPADEYWEQMWQLLSVEVFLRDHGSGRSLA
jgi:asparagine synthetase B (glutamine-hydrolysing)